MRCLALLPSSRCWGASPWQWAAQEPQPCASHRACRWPRTYHGPSLTARFICTLLQSQADPNYKLIAAAYPYMARRLLTDPAPELR